MNTNPDTKEVYVAQCRKAGNITPVEYLAHVDFITKAILFVTYLTSSVKIVLYYVQVVKI